MKLFSDCQDTFKGKKILFLATKNLDYIRVSQEVRLLRSWDCAVDVVGSQSSSFFRNLRLIRRKIERTDISDYDYVFITYMQQLVVPLFHRELGASIICTDFFISLYDTLVNDRQRVKKGSLTAKFLKWIDERTAGYSDLLICDTAADGKYFCEEFNIADVKMNVLYLEADPDIYYLHSVEKKSDYKDKFIVLYFGMIHPLQGVDTIFKAITQLSDIEDIHFIIIGPAGNKPITNNATYITWLDQDKLSDYIAMSDLCLAGHFNPLIDKADRTIPGKAYIYAAMGKKMILGDTTANREYFKDADENVAYVRRGDADDLVKAILKEYETWRDLNPRV